MSRRSARASSFAPFHFGSWDEPGDAEDGARPRAANELTITEWDPVSKQPLFKLAAVRVEKLADGGGAPAPAPTTTASAPIAAGIAPTVGGDGVTERTGPPA